MTTPMDLHPTVGRNQAGQVLPTDQAVHHQPLTPGRQRNLMAQASLLDALRHGRPITVGKGAEPDDKHRPAAVSWLCSSHGESPERWSHFVSAHGRWGPQLDPRNTGLTVQEDPNGNDVDSYLDHLLEAIRNDWAIGIYRQKNGRGVIAWDRESHGNQPALTIDPDGQINTYYNAPPEILDGYQEAKPTPQEYLNSTIRAAAAWDRNDRSRPPATS